MSKTYRPWNPDQAWLLPPSPSDWLSENHLVYFLLDVVRELDISSVKAKYEREDRGFPPFHPRMMVALLLYTYCEGVFSSRRIQKRCEHDIAYRVVVGDDVPNFRTISDFRKLNLKELEGLFVQVLRLCQKAGLVKLGHVSLDGTKIKANASRHKAMSYGRMKEDQKRLIKEIDELLQQAELIDQQEDAQYGASRRGDELPDQLARRQSRLKRIQEAKRALEAEAKEAALVEQKRRDQEDQDKQDKTGKGRKRKAVSTIPDDKKQYNFTDPQSRIMKANNKGWDQCCNAQAVVDETTQVIVAGDVTNESNDKQQVKPMIKQAQKNVGKKRSIKKVSADSGYFSEGNIQWLEGSRIDPYIATERIKHSDRVPATVRGRTPEGLTAKEKMARKLRTKKGRETYSKRKDIVEPVFGQIKVRGFVQFLLRGLEKMRGQWSLVCLTHNLLKLFLAQMVMVG